MLCEECHVNEANFTVSVVSGEETTVRHLCADCMSRMNADLMKNGVRNLLSSVLNAIRATAENEDRKEFSMPIFGRFTQKAQQTLTLAQRIAGELQQPYVGTEHMLLALLKTDASVPEAVGSKMSYDSIVTELKEHLKGISTTDEARGRIELSPRAKKTLENSVLESHKLGQNYVTVEHLWLALLGNDDGVAGGLFRKAGVDLSAAREQLLREMRENAGNEEKPRGIPGFMPFAPAKGRPGGGNEKSLLERFSRDLTAAAEKNELDPVIGRETEIQRIIQILIRRTKNNPVLIGEPGVGKSAVAEGLAQRIVQGNVPELLLGKRVMSLDIGSMVAGTKYRGEFEERLKNVMDELHKAGNVLLFIDEIHTIIGAGATEGSLDAANILKPALSRGEIQCIGATTLDEYRKHIEKDAALERRFQPVVVGEPTAEETLSILYGLRDRYEAHHKVRITDEALAAAVKLSDRYIPDRYLPDKAIDLMDEAASRVRIAACTAPPDVREQEKRLEAVVIEKKEAISHQDFEKAAALRDQERNLNREIEEKRAEWNRAQSTARDTVTEEDSAAAGTAGGNAAQAADRPGRSRECRGAGDPPGQGRPEGSEAADRQFHLPRTDGRREDGVVPRAGRGDVRGRRLGDPAGYVRVYGKAYGFPAGRFPSRLCRIRRRRTADGGCAAETVQRCAAGRGGKGASGCVQHPAANPGGRTPDGQHRPGGLLQEYDRGDDLQRGGARDRQQPGHGFRRLAEARGAGL